MAGGSGCMVGYGGSEWLEAVNLEEWLAGVTQSKSWRPCNSCEHVCQFRQKPTNSEPKRRITTIALQMYTNNVGVDKIR
ncbi:hypothetical protein AGMMS49936_02970 [Endomicrobiia bacterium]|nr:hypothetical protein AGMMS49936_02970 [Endomicrobiia bacterium]